MKPKNVQGSIMIFSLIILSLLLAISFALVATNNAETRSAINTDKSAIAFPLAESGAEEILDKIYSGSYDSSPLSALGNCSNGQVSGTLSTGTWTVTFYNVDNDALTSCTSTTWRSEADHMKIDGVHADTIRSIQMSIRPLG